MTDRSAGLVLKTSDITSKSDYVYGNVYASQIGSMNAKGSSMTWNNINLRTLLGDMYDKYDLFNLCLNTISTSQANTIDANAEAKNVVVRLSGLPWVNQSYNVKNANNGSSTVIATFNFTASTSSTQYYYSNNIATFGKNSDTCNITVEYAKILDDTVLLSPVYGTDITTLTGTGATNSNQVTISATNTSIVIGSKITASGIPANTFVTAINGTVLTISNNITLFLSSTAITISPLTTYPNAIFIFDIFGISKDSNNLNGTRI